MSERVSLTLTEIHEQQRALIRQALEKYPASLARYLAVCEAQGVPIPPPAPPEPITGVRYGHCRYCGAPRRGPGGRIVVCPCRAAVRHELAIARVVIRRAKAESFCEQEQAW